MRQIKDLHWLNLVNVGRVTALVGAIAFLAPAPVQANPAWGSASNGSLSVTVGQPTQVMGNYYGSYYTHPTRLILLPTPPAYGSGYGVGVPPTPPVIRGRVRNSTLVNPVIIDSRIDDSTLINPIIVDSTQTGYGYRNPTHAPIVISPAPRPRNPSCFVFAEIRAACQ